MPQRGFRQMLIDLIRSELGDFVSLGVVTEVEIKNGGRMLCVDLKPSGGEVLAREVQLGSGAQVGFYWPILVGDEVLVLFPDADRNAGVAISGLQSNVKASPPGDDNRQPGLTHPLGFEVRGPGLQSVEGVVKAAYLAGVQAQQNAMAVFMAAIVADVSNPAHVAAATAYQISVAASGYTAELAASVTLGPPYASTTLTTE